MNLLSEHNRILRLGEGGSQEYFPGDNINITDHVISGKYWDNEINSAISAASGDIVDSAYNKTTGWVDDQGFLTAHQDVDNLPYVQNSALGYNGVLVSSISGNGLFAESSLNSFYADSAIHADNANSATYADSANFVATANFANSASSALNAEVANVAYTALTANHVEGGWEHNDNGEITAYNHSAFAGGKGDYSGISPIVVDNEARIISAQSAKLGVQEPLYFVEDSDSATVIGIQDSAFPTFEGTEDGKISAINGSALNADSVVPYSGGRNIDITDYVISVTGIVDNAYHANSADHVQMAQSAHSAEVAISALNAPSSDSATYDSLGRKIVDTYLTAHQDWTNTIQNASGNAYNSAVNWVVDQHYLTAVTGDNTPYSAGANIVINDHVISVDTAIELTDITANRGAILDPSGLYVSDLDQSDYTEIGLDHVVSTDGSARIGWQLGNKEISVDVDSGNGNYAILHMSTADVMLEQRHPNPTPDAVYSLTGACQSAASAINMINSGDNQAYTAGANIDITDHVVSGKDWTSEIQAASAYAASQGGLEYEGVAPIVVNNIEHKISAQSALLGVQSPLYFVEDSESATVIGISGLPDVQGVMYESGLDGTDGYVTSYNGSGFSAMSGNPQIPIQGSGSVVITKINGTLYISGREYQDLGQYIPYTTITTGSNGTIAYSLNSAIRITGTNGWVEICGQNNENDGEAHLQVAQNFSNNKSFWAELDGIKSGILQMNWNTGHISPNNNPDYREHVTATLSLHNGGITYYTALNKVTGAGDMAWEYGQTEYNRLNSVYNTISANSAHWGNVPTRVVSNTAQATGWDVLYIVTGS